jgi:hypothetical protein
VRKILSSLFIIVALLGVGAFATSAYFSAGPYGGPMTLSSGNPDIAVVQVSPQAQIDTTNLAPGWSQVVCVQVTNDGTVPFGHAEMTVNSDGDPGLWDAMTLTVWAGAACNSGTLVASGTLHQFQGNSYDLGALPTVGSTLFVTQTIAFPDSGVSQNELANKSINVTQMYSARQ